jgi:hypothetical protein
MDNDIHNPSYTEKQFEYIHSVGGNAHITAIEIIGQLEEDLQSMTEREFELDEMQDETQKKLEKLSALCQIAMHPSKYDTQVYHECFGEMDELTANCEFATKRISQMLNESEVKTFNHKG